LHQKGVRKSRESAYCVVKDQTWVANTHL
jgi:hypothetical protein